MKTILLKFAGPLQSWGTSSHFETRHTDWYPSKSAVIGFIAACFGYRRNEDEKIHKLNELHFAVRIDQPGHILRDYHTAHKNKPNGDLNEYDRTYVTERYYLEDAVFVVALGSEDDVWMEEIENALKNPFFQPYLGRRSLPPTADVFLKTENQGVISALQMEKWQAASWFKRRYSGPLSIYADAELIPTAHAFLRKDRVESFSDLERRYDFRKEGRISVELNDMEQQTEEHDAFGALGE